MLRGDHRGAESPEAASGDEDVDLLIPVLMGTTSVIVDYPFVTGRSTPDAYLTGQKMVEVLENGLRRWGFEPTD